MLFGFVGSKVSATSLAGVFEPFAATSSGASSSSDENQSVFHSTQLDDLLAIETKKLEANLDSLLKRLNVSSQNMPVLYNTPKSQASYIKTLQTALLERNKTLQDNKKSKTVFGSVFVL